MNRLKMSFGLAASVLSLMCRPCSSSPLEPVVTEGGVEFSYKADAKAGPVAVAGEFNDWNSGRNFLKHDSKRGVWAISVPLGEGKYEYKFVVGGQWTDGPNLALELKKKEGRLVIAPRAQTPAPNTPYSGRINFSGKFVSEVGAARERGETQYVSAVPLNHLDIDWEISAEGGILAFARMEYESGDEDAAGLVLRQSSVRFGAESSFAEASYKKKSVSFDNPLKSMDRPVSLRYGETEFFDENNPHRAFGLWEQTAVFGWRDPDERASVKAFFSDMSRPATHFHTVEDNYGWRATYLFAGAPLRAGLTARHTRGGWWPWANTDNHWFPDPHIAAGYSDDAAVRGTAAVWYRGYTQSDLLSADAVFQMFPRLSFFGETASLSRRLQTERISGDTAHQKSWEYLRENTVLGGGKFSPADSLDIEVRAENVSAVFALPQAVMEGKTTSSARRGLSARWRARAMSVSVSASSRDNGILTGDIPADIHPWSANFFAAGIFPYEYRAAGGRLVRAVVKETSLSPSVKYESRRFSATVKSRLRNLEVLTNSTVGGVVYVSAAEPAEIINHSETLLDLSAVIYANWRAETSARISTWDMPSGGGYANYAEIFAALKYVFSKDSYVRLGWGLDPSGIDDDIMADFDRREVFLYNRSASAGGILSSEESLAALSAISLRVAFKW